MADIENVDREFQLLPPEEIERLEREIRRSRKPTLQLSKTAQSSVAYRRGLPGSPVDALLRNYRNRVLTAGGTIEGINCARAALNSLYR